MAKNRLPVADQIANYAPIPLPLGKKPSEMTQFELTCCWGQTQQDIYFTYLLKNYQKKIEKSANRFFEYLPTNTSLGLDLEDIYGDLLEKFQHAVLYSYLGILKKQNNEDTFSLAGAVTYYFKSYYSNIKKKCGTKNRVGSTFTQSLFRDIPEGQEGANDIRYVVPKKATNFLYLDRKASSFVETLSITEQTAFSRMCQGKVTDTRSIRTRILKNKFQDFQRDWDMREKVAKAKLMQEKHSPLTLCKSLTNEQFFVWSLQETHPTLPISSINLKGTAFARSRLSLTHHGKALRLLLQEPAKSRNYSVTKLSLELEISLTSARRMRGKLADLIQKLIPDLKMENSEYNKSI